MAKVKAMTDARKAQDLEHDMNKNTISLLRAGQIRRAEIGEAEAQAEAQCIRDQTCGCRDAESCMHDLQEFDIEDPEQRFNERLEAERVYYPKHQGRWVPGS
jgi:hypothetical protein